VTAIFLGTLIPLIFLMGLLRNEHRVLVGFFAWGLIAFMCALRLNSVILTDRQIGLSDLSIHIAPVIEEVLKMLPLLYFLIKRRTSKRYLIVYYAMASGIGFSILENYLYLTRMSLNSDGIMLMAARGVSTAVMHGIATAIIGMGLSFIQEFSVFVLPITFGLLSTAITGHSLYNLTIDSPYRTIATVAPLALYLLSLPLLNNLYTQLPDTQTPLRQAQK